MDAQLSNGGDGDFAEKIKSQLSSEFRSAPVIWEHFAEAIGNVIDALRDHKVATHKHASEISNLRGEIANLKAELAGKSPIKYLGVHRPGATYSEGSLVTRDGSMFHANKTTRETPGDGCQDWTLCVKHGRDGKDAPAK